MPPPFYWRYVMIGLGAALGLAAAGYGMSQANNLGTMFLGNQLGKKNMALQAAMNYHYAMKMAQNGPSASVAGLRKAGLNPILAATDGSFATPSFNGTSPSFPSSGSGGSNTMADAMAIKQSDANIDLLKSQSELNQANTKLVGVRAANEFANRGLSGSSAAISRLLSSFGFDDNAIKGMLPMFENGKSTPNGSVKSEGEVKMSHVASHDINHEVNRGVFDGEYQEPNEVDKKIYDELVRVHGKEAARAMYSPSESVERWHERLDDAPKYRDAKKRFERTKFHRKSPIFTR